MAYAAVEFDEKQGIIKVSARETYNQKLALMFKTRENLLQSEFTIGEKLIGCRECKFQEIEKLDLRLAEVDRKKVVDSETFEVIDSDVQAIFLECPALATAVAQGQNQLPCQRKCLLLIYNT